MTGNHSGFEQRILDALICIFAPGTVNDSLMFLTPKEKVQMHTDRVTYDKSSYSSFIFILLNLDTSQSKSAQNSWKSLTISFIGFLNQEFTEMWSDALSSQQNFYGFFQNSYFKGHSALGIPDSECSLVRGNSVFTYSVSPGDQG